MEEFEDSDMPIPASDSAQPLDQMGAGKIAHYASLSADYLERYLEENLKRKMKPEKGPAIALREMRIIARQAYLISRQNLGPEEERKALGDLGMRRGPEAMKNTFAIILGAIENIIENDRDFQGPLGKEEIDIQERGLTKGGALRMENFTEIKKELSDCACFFGECLGEAFQLAVNNKKFPTYKAPRAVQGSIVRSVGGQDAHTTNTAMGHEIAKILAQHESYDGPGAVLRYSTLGRGMSWAKVIAEAVDKGRDSIKRS